MKPRWNSIMRLVPVHVPTKEQKIWQFSSTMKGETECNKAGQVRSYKSLYPPVREPIFEMDVKDIEGLLYHVVQVMSPEALYALGDMIKTRTLHLKKEKK